MRARPQPKELLRRLEALMRGYGDLLKQQASTNPKVARLASLLDGFRTSRDCWTQAQAAESQRCHQLFEIRLKGYLDSRAKWAIGQRALADDFNLFAVMDLEYDEVTHSKLLAWLLDRRIEHGTHAQGNLGFQLFLEELREELGPVNYAEEPAYWVIREVSGGKSRIDIEIAARKRFIIHIENKILAPEGPFQVSRERDALGGRAEELKIPKANVHGIFLTLDGRMPEDSENNGFHPVGWRRIAAVLEKFADQAQAPEVGLFARHYAKAIHTLAISPQPKPITEETENDAEDIP